MNLHKEIITLIVLAGFFLFTSSSEHYNIANEKNFISDYTCPDNLNNSNNHSLEVIKVYLNSEGYETRKRNGEIGVISIEQVAIMKTNSDGYACNKLNAFVDYWLDKDPKWKYTYFKAGSTYFLSRWHDAKGFGFSPLFVFNSNFELISAGAY